MRLHRAAAFHHAVQPGGAQHLAGKVRALAGHIRHLGAAALVGIGIQVDGGAVGHLCARVGVLVGDRGSGLAALTLLQLMLQALNVQARARNGKAVQLSARAKGIVVGAVVAVLHHHMVHIIGFYRHIGVFVADG